ncbi:hypothetical protein I3842_14G027000 [Carya illinoinensis]|uniref:Uncharacterized protein n=1 Tax=Carya illinoinensis TaxID=32201 RepID=A0A922D9W5_CARIL|nr:hypothetical protein I3842_14G027000 [Carya illinoinensis]
MTIHLHRFSTPSLSILSRIFISLNGWPFPRNAAPTIVATPSAIFCFGSIRGEGLLLGYDDSVVVGVNSQMLMGPIDMVG